MEKLKNLLKSDTPTGDESEQTQGVSSGRVSGQGSHFPKDETATGTTSAYTQPSQVTTTGSIGRDIKDPSVLSADFPKTETSTDGSGSAAIGQTSTYSASHLSRGDPTSSVVDPESSDPLTYKKPEAGAHGTTAGVGSGSAAIAAGLAFNSAEERKKSDLAGSDNPYRTSNLDPRVDGLSKDSARTAATTAPTSTSATQVQNTSAGSGLAGAGASSAYTSSGAHETAPAPSSLTSTANPADRLADYSSTTHEKGLGSSSTAASAQPTTQTETEPQGTSMVGRALGAVGLGSVAGALGYETVSAGTHDSAVADTPDQPTTTTGLSSYTAPTQQGTPTTHHRKESIPTTAYPSGTFDSVRAINPPLGSVGSPVTHGDQESHTGRNVAAGAGAGVAAVGAAAIGSHEYEQSRALRENVAGPPQGTAPVLKEAGDTTATTGVDPARYQDAQTLRQNISDAPSTTGTTQQTPSTFHDATTIAPSSTAASSTPHYGTHSATEHSSTIPSTTTSTQAPVTERSTDHTARNTALGAGAGATVVGAGAYGAHEHDEKEAAKAQKQQQKELEKEEKQHQKELEKEQKHHQKELEKEEKQHQKEIAKEEKQHQKELDKEEQKLQKEREHEAELAAEKDRREREREQALVAKQREEEEFERRTSTAGRGGEKEKKPGFFKRIFKRRKNKDTGESEDYSSDEDVPGSHGPHYKGAAAASATAAAAAGTSAAAVREDPRETGKYPSIDAQDPHNKDAKGAYGANLLGFGGTTHVPKVEEDTALTGSGTAAAHDQEMSEAFQKPSYNPLHKDPNPVETSTTGVAPTHERTTADVPGSHGAHYEGTAAASTTAAAATGTSAAAVREDPRETGSYPSLDAQDPHVKDAKGAYGATLLGVGGVTHVPEVEKDTALTGSATAAATTEHTGTTSQQPAGAVTGLPAHDKSAVSGTSTTTHQPAGAVTGLPAHDKSSVSDTTGTSAIENDPSGAQRTAAGYHPEYTPENDDGLGHDKSLGQKVKDTFGMGGLEP